MEQGRLVDSSDLEACCQGHSEQLFPLHVTVARL